VTETLLNFRVPPAEKYAEIGAQFGMIVDPNIISANFKKHWRYMSASHPNFGQGTGLGWEKWWKLLVIKTFEDTVHVDGRTHDVPIFTTISDHLIGLYKTRECWKKVEGAEEILNHFYKVGVPLGVISNYDERLETVLKAMDLHHYFQFIITSYRAGFEKPDSRIFHLALCQLGNISIKPNEALHVGNMPEIDYLGAVKAGWNAALVHHNPKKVTEHYQGIDPELVFETLEDFQSYVIHHYK
jgi:REG-2-like HAD superfamily hydrolase